MREHNFHSVWCDHRSSGEAHYDELPYCYKQVHGVKLKSEDSASPADPNMWVYVTGAAHPCALASGERADDDHQYDGLELVIEHYVGDEWVDRKLRLTSDAARSLAAALSRAADIHQGLTR